VETTSLLMLALWTIIVKLPNFADPTANHVGLERILGKSLIPKRKCH